MAQDGSQVARNLVGGIQDAMTLKSQRDAVSKWVSDKEDKLKSAYQKALTSIEPTPKYDYTQSKFSGASNRKVAAPKTSRVARAKAPVVRKRTVGKKVAYGQ